MNITNKNINKCPIFLNVVALHVIEQGMYSTLTVVFMSVASG